MSSSLIWQILVYGWTASEVFIAIAMRTRRGGGKQLDRGSLPILWIAIFTSVTAAEWIGGAQPPNMLGGAHWLRIAAIFLMIAGLTIRWTAIVSLGKAFSANVAIRNTQTIYRSGLYRLVRHPSYTGLLIVFLSIGLYARNWLSLAVVLVPTTAALVYRIHVEEAALSQAFGPQYAEYRQTTSRLIPGIY